MAAPPLSMSAEIDRRLVGVGELVGEVGDA